MALFHYLAADFRRQTFLYEHNRRFTPIYADKDSEISPQRRRTREKFKNNQNRKICLNEIKYLQLLISAKRDFSHDRRGRRELLFFVCRETPTNKNRPLLKARPFAQSSSPDWAKNSSLCVLCVFARVTLLTFSCYLPTAHCLAKVRCPLSLVSSLYSYYEAATRPAPSTTEATAGLIP